MRKADLFSRMLWKFLCAPIGALSPAVPLTQFGASGPKPWHSAGAYKVVLLDSPLHIWLTGSMHLVLTPHPTEDRLSLTTHPGLTLQSDSP